MNVKNISILGDGAMATACAMLLDSRGFAVTMWGPFADHVEELERHRENRRYLPGIPLPAGLRFTADEATAMRDAQLIVSAAPTQFVRSVWRRFVNHYKSGVPIVSVAKGIENDTLKRPSQVIDEVLASAGPINWPRRPRPKVAVMSGPSIAQELAKCLPATVCVASEDAALAAEVQRIFTTNWYRVYTNPDVLGVELAGATKNVIAIAAGILDGLHAGYNAKSALLSRGLAEITRLGVAMGANAETFFGITGVGDLATTCFCPSGRNRSAGELLGKGMSLDQMLKQIPGVVEGVPTAKSIMQLARQYQVEMPITAAVHAVLFEGLDPIRGITMLMSREPKAERVK
ncbi:MAG: NAD(P)H-dependent glycerol-3-phosphate dehydrogenase [Phycisphaerales bacterium]